MGKAFENLQKLNEYVRQFNHAENK